MKKQLSILIILLAIAAVIFVGCTPPNAVTRISAQEAYDMMNELEHYVLLDVRTQSEFRQNRIQGALLIPRNEIVYRALEEIENKSIVILVYCQAGNRSAVAAQRLVDLGFLNVYDFGGINDWTFGTVTG